MSKAEALEQVASDIEQQDICPELRATATQLVFAAGNPDADLIFVGEAPGKNEDLHGKPFIGAAGKFLDEMLASINLDRDSIYITNIVKYRPPDNRDPKPEEIQAFMPFLLRQVDIIKPKLIVFLGRHAMNVFLPELKISAVHGQPKRKGGQVYLPLFHPAAALYNPSMREVLKSDFASIPKILEQL